MNYKGASYSSAICYKDLSCVFVLRLKGGEEVGGSGKSPHLSGNCRGGALDSSSAFLRVVGAQHSLSINGI